MATPIKPGKQLPLVWQNNDPNDLSTTYYVRATLTKSSDGSTIATQNLTNNGNGRYSYFYITPYYENDTLIDVTIKVYTDSGYSELSPIKTVEHESFIIKSDIAFGGGGGEYLSYADVKKAVSEVIATIKMPEQKEIDLSKIEKEIALVMKAISDKPITEKTDITPVIEQLKALQLSVSSLKFPETDLSDVKTALNDNKTAISELKGAIKDDYDKKEGMMAQMSDILGKMKPFFFDQMNELLDGISGLKKTFGKIQTIITKPYDKKDDEQDE